MTEKFNRYGIREVDHRTFGGIIYPSDFNTDSRGKNNTYGSPIAQRIVSDQKLDQRWKKVIEERNKNRNK